MIDGGYIVLVLMAWSAWGIFEKKALNQTAAKDVIWILYVLRISQIPIVIGALNLMHPGWHISLPTMILAGLAAALYATGIIAYITAMSKTEASLVIGFTALYPVISILLAIPLFGEKFIAVRLVGALVSILGVIGMGLSARKNTTGGIDTIKALIPCVLIATIAWGIWGIVDKQAMSQSGVLEFYLAKCIWDLPLLAVVAAIFKSQKHRFSIGTRQTWYFCSLSTVCLALGSWSFLSALHSLSASYVISMCACYPVGMYLLSVIFLKEKFDGKRLASLCVAILGTILVQISKNG